MPPEVPHFSSTGLATSLIHHDPPTSLEAEGNQSPRHKPPRGARKMKFTIRKLIPILLLVLASISILRFIRIVITTSSPRPDPALPPEEHKACDTSTCSKVQKYPGGNSSSEPSNFTTMLTTKEFRFLSDLVKHKAPCNILIFGLDPQYLTLSSVNAGGTTIILEDDLNTFQKFRTVKVSTNSTQVYKVKYNVAAKQAYKLLKHARGSPACTPTSILLQVSKCKLALKGLPQEVYNTNWDLIVVDGPNGSSPDAPGRMETIYTASILARTGNPTHVLVHDVDRTIEMWFSREYLCEENLVSSKDGKTAKI